MNTVELYRYRENPKSPKLFKLWSESTFVNFNEKSYISICLYNLQDLQFLTDHKYVSIDTAIADIIMRINCITGCKTSNSCSGHLGTYNYAYIWFTEITDDLHNYLSKSNLWFQDSNNPNIWRADGVNPDSTLDWLNAIKYLAEYPNLPPNSFKHIFATSESIPSDNHIYDRVYYQQLP